jgi:hypothetical protein
MRAYKCLLAQMMQVPEQMTRQTGKRAGKPVGPRSRISREGAKPQSSDERRTIFRHSPRAAPLEPVLDKGHPGRKPLSARRARQALVPVGRSGLVALSSSMRARGTGGRSSLMYQLLAGGFFRALDWRQLHFTIIIIQ